MSQPNATIKDVDEMHRAQAEEATLRIKDSPTSTETHWEGVVRIRDGHVPGYDSSCGLIMLEKSEGSCCTTHYYPLDHSLLQFKDKKVKVKVTVTVEEVP